MQLHVFIYSLAFENTSDYPSLSNPIISNSRQHHRSSFICMAIIMHVMQLGRRRTQGVGAMSPLHNIFGPNKCSTIVLIAFCIGPGPFQSILGNMNHYEPSSRPPPPPQSGSGEAAGRCSNDSECISRLQMGGGPS